ncbi:hypothetical protein OAT25_04825 [Candidatus Pelagibacter sp.]|nr:hypothetical protein [Candidatus Pelagibacter sp.]
MSLKANIYIPIEIMYRELTPRIYLAGCLAKAGYRVYIGSKSGIYNLIKNKKIKEGIFFYKSAFGKNTISTIPLIKKCDHAAILDEELGIGMGYVPSALEGRLINLKYISKFFVIGNSIKKKIIKKISKDKSKIISSGWPLYDLCKEKNLNYYLKEAKKIKKEYKNFYLFSSNFGFLNKKDLEIQKKNKSFKNSKKNKKIINEVYTNAYKDYKEFIKKINQYSEKNKKKIIIRPHPSDRIFKNWKNDVKINKNVQIIYKNDITPWILASDGLIHRGCSTSGVASLLNKRVFYLLPSRKLKNYEKNITYKISNKIKDLKFENKNIINRTNVNKILEKNIHNFSNLNSSKIIIKNLQTLKVTKTRSIHKFQFKLRLFDYLRKIKILLNTILFEKNKINLKMPRPILKKDIKHKLEQIFENRQYKVKSLGGETFEIDYLI